MSTLKNIQMRAFHTIHKYFNNYKSVEYNGHYVPEVLVKAEFTCPNDHFIGKWLSYKEKNGTLALWRLYGELDGENSTALLSWIFDNYEN